MKRSLSCTLAVLIAAAPAFAAAPGSKKKKDQMNLIELVPDMQPDQPRDAKGRPIQEEPDPPPEDAPYKDCVDSKGVAVMWRQSTKIQDMAQASFDKKKRPIVEYNPQRFKYLSEVSKQFFYAHECAHHVLGHLYAAVQGVDKEQQADCWAVLTLKENGTLGDDGLEFIQQDLGKVARSDPNHSAGVRRAGNLKWCLTEPIPTAKPQKP
jgi:hypothetical protein